MALKENESMCTDELLHFCAEFGVVPLCDDIQVVPLVLFGNHCSMGLGGNWNQEGALMPVLMQILGTNLCVCSFLHAVSALDILKYIILILKVIKTTVLRTCQRASSLIPHL